jgi:cell wall-associated NlpC family hydrolase
LSYNDLIGLEFNLADRNCYTLVRDFYRENYQIELTNYACPTNWWNHGIDLYSTLALNEGFEVLHCHPRDWKAGDIICCAIDSPTGNHLAILLDGGKILHHLYGQLSGVTSYGGLFRNTTVAVYRHHAVMPQMTTTIDFKDLLPAHVVEALSHRLPDAGA